MQLVGYVKILFPATISFAIKKLWLNDDLQKSLLRCLHSSICEEMHVQIQLETETKVYEQFKARLTIYNISI